MTFLTRYLSSWKNITCVVHGTIQARSNSDLSFSTDRQAKFFLNKVQIVVRMHYKYSIYKYEIIMH